MPKPLFMAALRGHASASAIYQRLDHYDVEAVLIPAAPIRTTVTIIFTILLTTTILTTITALLLFLRSKW